MVTGGINLAPETVLALSLTVCRDMRYGLWLFINDEEHYERYFKHRHAPGSLFESVNR